MSFKKRNKKVPRPPRGVLGKELRKTQERGQEVLKRKGGAMSLSSKLLRIPKATRWLVLVFIVLLLVFWSIKARGEELVFHAGSPIVRGPTAVVGADIRWPRAGPVQTDYELGLRLIGESTRDNQEQSNQIVVHGTLVDGWKRFRLGLGLAYLRNTDAYNSQGLNFRLMMAGELHKNVLLTYEHYSCAGTCSPNTGRDLILLGWRF